MILRTPSWLYGWLLLLPAMILLIGFTYLPMGATLWHSLFVQTTASAPPSFVGLDQYRNLLDDAVFRTALRNNLLYALVTVPASMALALLMALWVNRAFAGRSLLRLAFFTPTVLPMVAAANVWLFFYAPDIGLLNRGLAQLHVAGHNWLGQADTALWALMSITIWKEAGFFMVFYLAALQAMPPEVLDAARLEAGSASYRLRRVILPLLGPTTLFVAVNALINAFKLVDHLFILTKGGPNNASTLLLYYLFETAFRFQDGAYAASQAVLLLILLMACAAVQLFLTRNRVHYR
ncbi:carbohydrate ABC transporter permease [Chitinimonas sp.]|uniref:carbohydrate ABC transporter permease n=1 Tax=Chitinimonas sp. TaxID=1934313 RepID=UPI0035AF6394